MHEIVCAMGTLNFKWASIFFNNVKQSKSNTTKVNVFMLHNRNHSKYMLQLCDKKF